MLLRGEEEKVKVVPEKPGMSPIARKDDVGQSITDALRVVLSLLEKHHVSSPPFLEHKLEKVSRFRYLILTDALVSRALRK